MIDRTGARSWNRRQQFLPRREHKSYIYQGNRWASGFTGEIRLAQGYAKRSMEAEDDINSIAEKVNEQDWGKSQQTWKSARTLKGMRYLSRKHQHESRNARFKLTRGKPYLWGDQCDPEEFKQHDARFSEIIFEKRQGYPYPWKQTVSHEYINMRSLVGTNRTEHVENDRNRVECFI